MQALQDEYSHLTDTLVSFSFWPSLWYWSLFEDSPISIFNSVLFPPETPCTISEKIYITKTYRRNLELLYGF